MQLFCGISVKIGKMVINSYIFINFVLISSGKTKLSMASCHKYRLYYQSIFFQILLLKSVHNGLARHTYLGYASRRAFEPILKCLLKITSRTHLFSAPISVPLKSNATEAFTHGNTSPLFHRIFFCRMGPI